MANTQNPNLEILELAIHQLGELADDLVFVGGCATGLLLTDPAAAPVRATYDVDAIAQVLSRFEVLRQNTRSIDAVAGHLAPDAASQARLPRIIGTVEAISKLS